MSYCVTGVFLKGELQTTIIIQEKVQSKVRGNFEYDWVLCWVKRVADWTR